MKPYEIINHTIDDIINRHFKDDYCLHYFMDNIRYDHNQGTLLKSPFPYTMDKHLNSGNKWSTDRFECFYHNGEWINGHSLEKHLRDTVKNNFLCHSYEPINVELDKELWNTTTEIIVLHSEKNSKDLLKLEQKNFKHIHWFSHAYLCSKIYFKHYQKLKMVTDYKSRPIKYRWLSANRLLRQHRTDLLEKINLNQGCYSLLSPDPNGLIYTGSVPTNSFDSHENHSAEIRVDTLSPWNTSFLHIVNETVWQEKIHFTEKVFKPIVMHQPFIISQAPGSLEYLRSYGFKTFDCWWDESYDKIQDPNKRLDAIADIVNYIGNKSLDELEVLRMKMADVLEHNFRHFYENIPAITLGELERGIKLLL